jgi:hypothetical protein
MREEILDIEDDDACVEIPNFIPLLDDRPHNEIFKFPIMNGCVCILFVLIFLPFKIFILMQTLGFHKLFTRTNVASFV